MVISTCISVLVMHMRAQDIANLNKSKTFENYYNNSWHIHMLGIKIIINKNVYDKQIDGIVLSRKRICNRLN